MQRTKIRVLIVEDSRLYQTYLSRILERDSCFQVAGIAGSGKEAMEMAETLKPDVITLDLNLPDVSGFELLKYLLDHTRKPVIVVSSMPQACEEAIRLGAKDFINKIPDTSKASAEHFAMLLQMKIKMQALPGGKASGAVTGAAGREQRKRTGTRKTDREIIVIGASLGGTESTAQLLRGLPADMPGILIVQHMQVGYTKAYAMRLNRCSCLKVSEAKDGDRVLPGSVLVAESGKHMKLVETACGYHVRCRPGDKVMGFCPSVDVLFHSVAETKASGVGVILTGMGRDGVSGIRRMHEKGFYTIGQDKESSAIFGMPQAAYQAGALDELLNPQQIAARLIERYR